MSGDVHIAYQIIGSGQIDLVVLPGFMSHLDLQWEQDPRYRAWVRRLSSFARLILYDKRCCGLSDRDVGEITGHDQVEDLRSVLDAANSQRCALVGVSSGGALAIQFASSYPARVASLVLDGAFASSTLAQPPTELDGFKKMPRLIESCWGEGRTLEIFSPASWGNSTAMTRMSRLERASLSPRAARAYLGRALESDVQAVARELDLPTLVLHRSNDAAVPVEFGRWLGFNIPGARYVEQLHSDHLPWGGDSAADGLDEIEQFLTGSKPDVDADRFLTTVMFTDIARSTDHLARVGDRAWAETLAQHHELVRRLLSEFHGQEMDTTGDGFFATFSLPARAVRCALAVRDAVRHMGIDLRAGVHTGECQRQGNTVVGIAVHTTARLMALAQPGQVLVSRTVTDLVAGSGLDFQDHGMHALRGVPGEWRLFRAN